VEVVGRAEARRAVDLAPEVAGRLREVAVDVSDRLGAGQAAFRLDDSDARLTLENARARLGAAAARRRQAARRQGRVENLGDEGISAPEAEVVAARQQLGLAERGLEKTTVVAPWDATVVRRHADPGAWVLPGTPVLSLVDLSVVRVAVDLPAADAVHVRAGDPATVTFPSLPGETWAGRVAFVAARAGEGSLQFPAEIELAGEERLAAGMVARVALELGRAGTGLAVPLDALDRGPGGSFVWRLEGGAVSRVAVVVAGARGGRAMLTAGVEAGDQVALAPHAGLSDGLAVGEVSVAPVAEAR